VNDTTVEQLLIRVLSATAEKRAAIERILDGRPTTPDQPTGGPILLGMREGARLISCSRSTLWRLIRAGKIKPVELLPGCRRIRRRDLEELAHGQTSIPTNDLKRRLPDQARIRKPTTRINDRKE